MAYAEFLNKLQGMKYNLSLNAISGLLRKIGNPHKKLRVVHVAGTNGKGSTCAFISSILQESGYKVGLYTSPHLVKVNERIQINRKNISDIELNTYARRLKKVYQKETYFEFLTALAFLYFFDNKVDFAVIEVGMGGRLDATNVVNPLVSVITNIGLEHQEYLGKTIAKIAAEKAGIIKWKRPVVTGTSGDALEVIKNIAERNECKLHTVKADGKKLKLGLKGEFQKHNALLALKAIEVLQDYGIKINGIKGGLLNAKWPGRFEFIGKNLLIDCAHNPDGISVLKNELFRIKNRYNRLIFVTGILKDKNYGKMLAEISSLADFFVLTKPKTERATEPKTLAKYVKNKEYKIINDVKKAVFYARRIARSNDLVVVTGSIYTVGEVLRKA